jgi:hypothetical protein
MVVRSLNGLNGSTTNVIITNHMDAALPLEQTQANTLSPIVLSIKGLSTMGAENQIMKVNGSGVLAWAIDTDTTYSVVAPLNLNGTQISLTGLSTLQQADANKVIKVNSAGNALEYATDIDTTYSVVAPLNLNGTQISLTGLTTLGVGDAYKVIKVNSAGNALEYATDNTDPSKWTLNGAILYPNSIASNVVIGTTSNPNSRKFYVNGDAECENLYAENILLNNGTTQSYIRFYDSDSTGPEYVDLKAPADLNANYTLTLPANITGTLAVANSTIAFGDDGLNPVVRSYIFDPRKNSGTPTSVYNVLSYHENGTETAINNWSAGNGGLSSHISFNFGGAMKFRFHTDETIKVGSKAYSFPTNAGTLALVGETSNWTVSSNIISPASPAVDTLKMKNIQNPTYSGTKLIENNYNGANYGWSMYGTNPKFILGLGGTGNVSYPMLGNDAGGFLVHINNTGDCFKIDTSKNATFYGNRLDIGTHLRLETVSTNNHYLTDPNSTVGSSNNEYVLYYNTASTLSILNAGDPNNGEVRLSVGGSPMFSVDSGTCKVLTSEFQTPRFKIVSNGSETYINNPDPAANSSPFLTYHQNGTDLNFSTPVGGSANTSYIRHYIGSQLKLFIGGASTINYTPMVIEGSLTITNNGDLTMYNGDLIMTGGNIDITGNISGTTCEIDIDGGVNCLGGVSANALGCKVGFQDTLPGYGTNLYGVHRSRTNIWLFCYFYCPRHWTWWKL